MSSVNALTRASASAAAFPSTNRNSSNPAFPTPSTSRGKFHVTKFGSGGAASASVASPRGGRLNPPGSPLERVFELSYDATEFGHLTTTRHITVPGRRGLVEINDEPVGRLGLFSSKARAMVRGSEWLYEQLSRLNDQPHLPLLYRREGEFGDRPLPGNWRRTGWQNDTYVILDEGRYHDDYADVSLLVRIEERFLDRNDDGNDYETETEDEGEYVPGRGRGADGIIGMQARAA